MTELLKPIEPGYTVDVAKVNEVINRSNELLSAVRALAQHLSDTTEFSNELARLFKRYLNSCGRRADDSQSSHEDSPD